MTCGNKEYECDCVDKCFLWNINDDGSGGYFCPYIPGNEEFKCKKTLGIKMNPTIRVMEK